MNLWTTSTKAAGVSGTVFFKHNYNINPETTPTDAIIAAANRMTETLHNHTPIKVCKDDLEALRRLETTFARVAATNTNIQIKETPIQKPPRVLPTTPNLDTKKHEQHHCVGDQPILYYIKGFVLGSSPEHN